MSGLSLGSRLPVDRECRLVERRPEKLHAYAPLAASAISCGVRRREMKRLSKDQKQQRADLVTRLNDAAEAVRAALAAGDCWQRLWARSSSFTHGARG